jgi:acyl-CoA synthetase (NDP forming)
MDRAVARALLAPRSIALVGASDDPTKTASRPLQYLRRAGFTGRIYPVNAHRDTVLGERAWRSLDALPEQPDHAFILLPAEAALDAISACARLGIPVATVLASGFAEAGEQGVAREQRLRALIQGTQLRVIGPSSLGIANLHHNLVLTANAAFAEPNLRPGGIFCASQSGSMIGALLTRGSARGLGFAGLVSVGGEVDLGIGELCTATLDDPQVTSYLLFLETIRHAEKLREFALGAAERGKPVVAYKLGRSAEARELALSHTGALAGEDDVADAFLADCGIARADTLEGLLELPTLLKCIPARRTDAKSPSVAVVTTTGGGAAMVVDQLAIRNVSVIGPDDATLARIQATGVEVQPGRILDLTLAGTRSEIMKAALAELERSDRFDLIVAVVGSSARFQPELAVQPIVEHGRDGARVAAFLVPEAPEALRMLADAGIPAFRTPESCADAISAALRRRWPRARAAIPPEIAARPGRTLDEMEGYSLLKRLGIPHAPTATFSLSEAGSAPLPFDYPIAIKALDANLPHKSDCGAVILNVATDAERVQAVQTIAASVRARRPDFTIRRILVQPMMSGVGEALLGYRVDPQVGPYIVLAAGGVLTEVYRDRSVRIAPVTEETAAEMIQEVKALTVLAGIRGRPAGDLAALKAAIVALSRTALLPTTDRPSELEVNPLIVKPAGEGVVAVDVLGRLPLDQHGN